VKNPFKTIYGKVASIFLGLLFLVGAIQVFLSLNAAVNYVCETTQKLNYGMAKQLAERCEPMMADSSKRTLMSESITNLKSMNPHVEIFLLNEQGKVLAYFNKGQILQRSKVGLKPIRAFLKKGSFKKLPIMGEDPFSENKKIIFSAARMMIAPGKMGYLYVTLPSVRYDLSENDISSSYILRNSILSLMATLLFGGLFGLVVFFFLTKRVHRMTKAVRRFENGQYHQRIKVTSDDEIGDLAKAFNHMAETIEQNMREMEKNDHLRRELIANISHDLRSPLTSIQGYIETVLIKGDKLAHTKREEYLEIILKNVVHLSNLVQELFELSKLDAKESEPHPEPFSIAELVQDVLLKFQPKAQKKGVNLVSKLPLNLPMVLADIGMIERVISNLIDNALNFTPPAGRVKVGLQREGEQVQISVSDTGAGIPEDEIAHIFDRFYMVEKSRTGHGSGSGLGLAIARKIVEAHGGQLSVFSKVKEGTEFVFTLPVYKFAKQITANLSRQIF